MLRLAYTLQEHGWATVSIGDGETASEIEATFLSDALGDLARAVRGILRGLTEAHFNLEQEPGEHRVSLARDGEMVHINISRFAESFSRRQSGERVWTGSCSVRELATACINCLRRVIDEHGVEGYLQRWKNHPFPLQEFHDLVELRRGLS